MQSLFDKISAEVELFITNNKSTICNANTENINIKVFKSREGIIKQLEACIDSYPILIDRLTTELARAKTTHAAEICVADTILGKSKSDKNFPTIRETGQTKQTYATAASKQKKIVPDALPLALSSIKITNSMSIPAVRVNSFNSVKQNGEIYYIEPAEHFAVRICGVLLHGNIGKIYTDEKNPTKIKDCKFGQACVKKDKCEYYHDPLKISGSKDHRNFIANSFLYSPPDSLFKSHFRARQYGSRDHLESDIHTLSKEEIYKFWDQAMHDLLCAILLHKHAQCDD